METIIGDYIGTTIGIHSPHSLLIKHQGEACRVQVGSLTEWLFLCTCGNTFCS